jgi:nucleotide-binding universal stress UspA family protein
MMKKIERILVAIDFSEPSFNALETAVSLSEKCDASLYIMHVKDYIFEFLGANSFSINSVSNNSWSILTALSIDIAKKSTVRPILIEESGNTTEEIVKAAVRNNCNLVVLGTYGASGYRSGFIGTTALSVIKYVPCAVMIIPAQNKWTSFQRPLLPIRPVMTALRHYDLIRELVEKNSTLHILGLNKPESENAERDLSNSITELQDKLDADKITTRVQWSSGNSISQHVISNIHRNNPDLVVVTPAIDVSNKQFYIGPNAHYIINNAKVPTLIISRVNVQSGSLSKMVAG